MWLPYGKYNAFGRIWPCPFGWLLGGLGVAFGITLGDDWFDMFDVGVDQLIQGWIRSGVVRGVLIEVECKSWPQARHGPPGSNWAAIRSPTHPYGIPDVSAKDQLKLDLGNAMLKQTIHTIRSCIAARIPCFVENPNTSFLWQAPSMARLMSLACSSSFVFDMCAFGAAWRKRTRLAVWNGPSELAHTGPIRCHCRKGLCSFSGNPHSILTGKAPSGAFVTSAAASPVPVTRWALMLTLLLHRLRLHLWLCFDGLLLGFVFLFGLATFSPATSAATSTRTAPPSTKSRRSS